MTIRTNGYQDLVNECSGLLILGRKINYLGGLVQLAILVFTNAWKHLGFSYYKLVAPVLIFGCIYQIWRDFSAMLKVDNATSNVILKGRRMEMSNSSLGRYFHHVIEKFDLTSILMMRCLENMLIFGYIGYSLSLLIQEFYPWFTIKSGWLMVGSCLLATFLTKPYYDSLNPIQEAKLILSKAGK